jgi:methionyl-tRNA synthetase
MNPEWLRYYLGAKLNGKNEDIDFNPKTSCPRQLRPDRQVRQHRLARRRLHRQALRRQAGHVSDDGQALLASCAPAPPSPPTRPRVRQGPARDHAAGRQGQRYVDANKPWELAKQEGMDARLHDVCSTCIEAFRLLTIYLKPVLPALAAR